MLILLLAQFLTFAGCLSQSICPSKEDIQPCLCFVGKDNRPWVSCEGIGSVDELRTALKGLKNYKLSLFNLEKSNIGILPADIFSDIEIQELEIFFTNLTGLSESLNRPPFLGLEKTLESLEIQDSFTNEKSPLTRLSLCHLKKMTLLHIEGNILPTIGNDWFESGPYGLTELYLLDTRTSKLGSHVFMALMQLKKLSLTGGSISKITRDMFPKPARFMESLDFSNNQISSLPKDLFYKMPSLKEISLENNALTTISEAIYAQIWSQVSHVFYYGNPLNCDDGIKWIYKYRLPESLIGACASPPTLRSRSLSNLTLEDFV